MSRRFADFAAEKMRAAERACLHPLRTITDKSHLHPVVTVGNGWTRSLYDGSFHLWSAPEGREPAVSLVFVQSRDGNTGARNPADLGGGETDKHLLYEGLSRVAADAVLAGAKTVDGEAVFFSVWHPELVALRESLGLPRHPAQVIVTGRGCIDAESSLICNVPDVPLFVVGGVQACAALGPALSRRPWVRVIPMDDGRLRRPLERLRHEHGLRRISVVGGRTTATTLLDEGLVQDIYLTTTNRSTGEPGTPLYAGMTPPLFEPIVRKRGTDPDAPVLFEHLAVISKQHARGRPRLR